MEPAERRSLSIRLLAPERRWVAALAGLGLTVVGMLPTVFPRRLAPLTAGLIYVLVVVLAARVFGLYAGISAAVASFLALNFFSTPPYQTFRVEDPENVAALFVFLVVACVVGVLLSTAVESKEGSEQREREMRLLSGVSNRLLAGEPPGDVMRDFGDSIAELVGVVSCSVEIGESPGRGASHAFPILAKGKPIGRIVVVADPGESLAREQKVLLASLASQVALAIEGERAAAEARDARLEAETVQARK